MKHIKGIKDELKKVTWISKGSLVKTTLAVICMTLFLSTYIYGVDSLSEAISKIVIQKI